MGENAAVTGIRQAARSRHAPMGHPTQRAAMAIAARCDGQRSAVRLQSHRTPPPPHCPKSRGGATGTARTHAPWDRMDTHLVTKSSRTPLKTGMTQEKMAKYHHMKPPPPTKSLNFADRQAISTGQGNLPPNSSRKDQRGEAQRHATRHNPTRGKRRRQTQY